MKDGSIDIKWNNPCEILGMGGPWVGGLVINGEEITDSAMVDNYLFDKIKRRLYFVKYHKISKWAKDNFFLIHYYDLDTRQILSVNHKYEMVYLDSIIDNKLVVFNSFHNKDASKKAHVILE